MKELQIKGLITVEGMKFHEIEGGFGEGKKSMLVKEIAGIHKRPLGKINELINNNRKRFTDMIDIIDLKANPSEGLGYSELGYTKQTFNQSKNIYLLSERGYSKLLKILDDDFAWEQYDKLVDSYFNMREVLKEQSMDSYMIEDPYSRALRWAEEYKEKMLLQKEIEVAKPKVAYYDNVLDTKGSMTTTQIAKSFGMTSHKLNTYLNDKGIQFKMSGMWMLYKEYDGKGYAEIRTYVNKKKETTTHYLVWTEKGKEFIYNLLLEDKIIK